MAVYRGEGPRAKGLARTLGEADASLRKGDNVAMKHLLTMAAVVQAVATIACNAQRKQECDKFLSAMQPLEQGVPTAETVERSHTVVVDVI